MEVRYQNVPSAREAPPEYSSLQGAAPESETVIMIPIRKEIRQVDERRSRHQLIKRYVWGFSIGFIFCAVTFLILHFLWKHYASASSISPEMKEKACQRRLLTYYNGWDNRKISEKQLEKLTHIIFDGIKLQPDGKIDFGSDEQRLSLLDMKNKASIIKSNLKIMFSTDAYATNLDHVAPIMTESKTRKAWINSVALFILEQQLDGVELYYRYPESKEDKENFVFFVRELRYKLENLEKLARRQEPYLIAVVAPSSGWIVGGDNFLNELLKSIDFFNVEADNYYGPWLKSSVTGPLSPLYSTHSNKSIDWTMKDYTCNTLEPSRFNFIVPFRGVYFKNVKDPLNPSNEIYRSVELVDGKHVGTPAAWRHFEKLGFDLSKTIWNEDSRTPYIWNSKSQYLYTFDNARSIKEKMSYMVSHNLGGLAIRRLEYDDDSNTLFNAVTSIDMCTAATVDKDKLKYECAIAEVGYDYLQKRSTVYNMNIIFFVGLLFLFI